MVQVEKSEEYAKSLGFTHCEIFDADSREKGVSGFKEHRQGLSQLYKYLDNNEDCKSVFLYNADRLGRDNAAYFYVLRELQNRKVDVYYSQDETIVRWDKNTMASDMKGLAASDDYRRLVSKLSDARKRMKSEGKLITGATPVGYIRKNIGTLKHKEHNWIKDEKYSEVIELILNKYAFDGLSIYKIVDLLNARGYQRKLNKFSKGGLYTFSTVRRILLSCYTYAGFFYQGTNYKALTKDGKPTYLVYSREKINELVSTGEIVPFTNIEPYITMETAKIIDKKLTTNQLEMSGRQPKFLELFRGMVYCGKCGRKAKCDLVMSTLTTGKKGYVYYTHNCTHSTRRNANLEITCQGFKSIRADNVSETIYHEIIKQYSDDEIKAMMGSELLENKDKDGLDSELFRVETQLERIGKQLERYLLDYDAENLTGLEFRELKKKADTQRTALLSRKLEITPKLETLEVTQASHRYLLENAGNIRQQLEQATGYEARRVILEELNVKVYIHDDGLIKVSIRDFTIPKHFVN